MTWRKGRTGRSGGTHVRSTSEIGPVRIGKIEKKGKQNRRVYLWLD